MAKPGFIDEKPSKPEPKVAHVALAEVRKAQQAAKEMDWHRVNLALEAAAKLLES